MIEYRRAKRDDADAIAHLHARIWRESFRGIFPDAFLDGELPEERIRVWRARLRRPPANQLVQLAFDGPRLLGFVCAYGAHDPQWGSFVDNLHVAQESQGRGIGASLLRQAATWLAAHHADRGVYLLVLEANAGARRFYESLGARNAAVFPAEIHGGAVAPSCRYTWPRPDALIAGG